MCEARREVRPGRLGRAWLPGAWPFIHRRLHTWSMVVSHGNLRLSLYLCAGREPNTLKPGFTGRQVGQGKNDTFLGEIALCLVFIQLA